MSKYLYHATDQSNEYAIMNEGLKPGIDGGTYFADSVENALKFMAFRVDVQKIIVLKVSTEHLDKKLLEESFDHSEFFFKCKAWVYMDHIQPEAIQGIEEYERKV